MEMGDMAESLERALNGVRDVEKTIVWLEGEWR
jgi:hypothetical protein